MDVEVAKDKAQEIGAEEIIVEHIIAKRLDGLLFRCLRAEQLHQRFAKRH